MTPWAPAAWAPWAPWPAPPVPRATARAPAGASASRPQRAWHRGARPPGMGGKTNNKMEKNGDSYWDLMRFAWDLIEI